MQRIDVLKSEWKLFVTKIFMFQSGCLEFTVFVGCDGNCDC